MANTRKIQLTQGKFAIVDAEDYDWLNKWRWFADKGWSTFYAARHIRKPHGKRTSIRMHQQILATPEGLESDHVNGNGLDNRRANLRTCTSQENSRNQKLREDNTSGYKGVYWNVQRKKWHARIGIGGKQEHLGLYDDIEDAIAVRQAKEIEVFGEFAYINHCD